MAVNYPALGFVGGTALAYIKHKGISQFKKEFQDAKYSVFKKGSNLDLIVQASGLGEFEIKIIKDRVGKLDLDEINYTSNNASWPKMDLYKKSSAIIPKTSISPFTYIITTRRNNISARFFVNYGIINGSTKLNIGPDKRGIYQIKQVTFYNYSGKRWFSFVPTPRKPKLSASIPAKTQTTTSNGNPSP